jgi:hypothetical protein
MLERLSRAARYRKEGNSEAGSDDKGIYVQTTDQSAVAIASRVSLDIPRYHDISKGFIWNLNYKEIKVDLGR